MVRPGGCRARSAHGGRRGSVRAFPSFPFSPLLCGPLRAALRSLGRVPRRVCRGGLPTPYCRLTVILRRPSRGQQGVYDGCGSRADARRRPQHHPPRVRERVGEECPLTALPLPRGVARVLGIGGKEHQDAEGAEEADRRGEVDRRRSPAGAGPAQRLGGGGPRKGSRAPRGGGQLARAELRVLARVSASSCAWAREALAMSMRPSMPGVVSASVSSGTMNSTFRPKPPSPRTLPR